jgi:hypothetical protein
LVAAVAGHERVLSGPQTDPVRGRLQEAIADALTERFVDEFEAVDVDEEEREARSVASRFLCRDGEAFREHQPIREAGEFVEPDFARE